MENFYQPIEKLLAKHDYVVVPELGGFVVQLQSAQLFSDQITPPVAVVGFNPLMHHSDGLLAIQIARSEKISYRQAVEIIEKEVNNIKNNLRSKGNVQIGDLGVLNQNETGIYLFSPNQTADFLPQNFGLTKLYVSTKDKNSIDQNRTITIKLPSAKIYKYVAAAMIVLGLFFISPRLSDVRQTDYAGLASLAVDNTSENNTPTETNAQTTETVKVTEVSAVPEITKNFHVIVACLSTHKSADKFCKELIEDNFTEAHILPPIITYRIAIQSFSDKEQAIQFMNNLRKTDSRFETAWVLCNK
jgi:hypothetical protein